jgi:hypothetical protein
MLEKRIVINYIVNRRITQSFHISNINHYFITLHRDTFNLFR